MSKIKDSFIDKPFDDFEYQEEEYLKQRERGLSVENELLNLDVGSLRRAIEEQQETLAGLLKSLKEFQDNLNRGFKDLNEDVSVF